MIRTVRPIHILLGIIFVTLFLVALTVFAGDTGRQSPTTVEATGNWTSFSDFTADEDIARCLNSANCDAGGGSEDGQLSDFSFAIPAGATIDGIEVFIEAECYDEFGGMGCATNNSQVVEIALSWDDGSSWTTVRQSEDLTFNVFEEQTFGSSTDTWGRTWSPSEFADGVFQLSVGAECGDILNCSTGFGVSVRAPAEVRVYYTESATPGVQISSGTLRISGGSVIISK